MSERRTGPLAGRDLAVLALAFFGIFVYGLVSALPGSVLPTLERSRYLPDDSAVATFLLINAVGALFAYLVSGPVIDRVGMKAARGGGALVAAAALAGLGPIFPTSVGLASALVPRIAGTAISLVMAVWFAGLLAVVAASALMFILHLALTLRESSRAR